MFDKLKKFLKDEFTATIVPIVDDTVTVEPTIVEKAPSTRKTKPETKEPELTPKEKATAADEPYVAILSVDLDPNDINNGSFELDWNDKFIANLIRHGYKFKQEDTDSVIVDRWFTAVCKNVVLEIYEQNQADPDNRPAAVNPRHIAQRDLGDGLTEVS